MERAGVDAPRNSRTPPGDTAITRRSGDGRDGTWVWSDGSAEAGVSSGGGGGTLLILKSGECRETRVAAGLVCSSTRTELFAMRAAVEEVSGLSGGLATGPAVLCSDSQASLLLVAGGAGPQQTPIGADIWRLLGVISARGQDVVLQWVPTHFGLPGNEQADVLAKEASELAQEVPTDVRSITKAVARSVNRAWRLSWPDSLFRRIWRDRMPSPVPGEDRGGGGQPWMYTSSAPVTGAGRASSSTGSAVSRRRPAGGAGTSSARRHYVSCDMKRPIRRSTFSSTAPAWPA